MKGESPHIGTHRNRKNCLDLTTYSSDHVFIQHALRMPCLSPSAHEVQNPCRQDPPNMTAYVFIPQVLKQVQGSEKGGSRELELATRNQSLVCDSKLVPKIKHSSLDLNLSNHTSAPIIIKT